MVSVGLCILDSIALIETVLRISQMYALVLDIKESNVTDTTSIIPRVGGSTEFDVITVEKYARDDLCRTFDGQKYFYNAMKTKFCSLTMTFTAEHVIDLCRKRDNTLDRWVAELFDFDGNGYITHYEKSYYEEL